MHRKNRILVVLLLALMLSGCEAPQNVDRLFSSDTVINIPLNPQEETAVPETTIPAEKVPTGEPIQPSTAETEPLQSGGFQSAGSKSSSGRKAADLSAESPGARPPEMLPPETVSPEAAVYEISDYVPGGLEYAVAEQINFCRVEAGLEPLAMDLRLSGISSVRAYEVCISWSHTRTNGSGWQTVLSDYGYGCSSAAELLAHAAGFDAASIVCKWMDMDGGGDLLDPDFTVIGVGSYDENGTTFLAAILLRP